MTYRGMGYSAETRVERGYRDACINRIFEGTNEINRMLTVDMILKKAMKGQMDLMTPAMAVAEEIKMMLIGQAVHQDGILQHHGRPSRGRGQAD